MNSNYLKQEISGVSEFKLKQLKSPTERNSFYSISLHTTHLAVISRGGNWRLHVGHKHSGGSEHRAVINDRGCSCSTGQGGLSCATDTAKINAMKNGRVLVGNYCGSLAGRVTAN